MTALLIAAKGGFTDCVSLLISRGADINAKDYKERTFLSLATDSVLSALEVTVLSAENSGVGCDM